MAKRADAAPEATVGTLEQLLAAREIAISCGSGGVGKTTTAAAAAAMAAVHLGGKVLVLTVDPAKRLANALGLERFGEDRRFGHARLSRKQREPVAEIARNEELMPDLASARAHSPSPSCSPPCDTASSIA